MFPLLTHFEAPQLKSKVPTSNDKCFQVNYFRCYWRRVVRILKGRWHHTREQEPLVKYFITLQTDICY
jgi:hypothetical protein